MKTLNKIALSALVVAASFAPAAQAAWYDSIVEWANPKNYWTAAKEAWNVQVDELDADGNVSGQVDGGITDKAKAFFTNGKCVVATGATVAVVGLGFLAWKKYQAKKAQQQQA